MRHPLPEARWPTKAEAECSRLFSSLRLTSGLELTQRTWVPAMVPWRATEEGFVTEENRSWYGRFARGRPGVLVVEATGIRDIPSGPLLRIGHDRFISGLRSLVERVREESTGETRLFIQLIDFLVIRRRPDPLKFFRRYLRITDAHRRRLADVTGDESHLEANDREVRETLLVGDRAFLEAVLDSRELESLDYGYRERVWDLHLEHIRRLPDVLPRLFAEAACRARDAGFDGVELHFAHAYTMASFLSALNTRDDGYGGDLEGRLRLPLEVTTAVRAAVGGDFTLGCRYLGDEVIAGGYGVEDAALMGEAFAGAGMDFLSISKGGKFEDARQPRIGDAAYPYTGPSGQECMPTTRIGPPGPFGRNVPLARTIRARVRQAGFVTPVVTAGGLCTFDQMEGILQRGDADIVAAARQALADPDMWRKMREGRGASIRRCEYTNYCEGLDQKHKQVTCRLWDRLPVASDEVDPPRTPDGRRLLPPD
ncbi:MAG TPA: NADH:flavin oxidoreductase [Planctomycetes bacterium]|nr:NADH:flavin oxidoreductase [Planctomycetota bacterium]